MKKRALNLHLSDLYICGNCGKQISHGHECLDRTCESCAVKRKRIMTERLNPVVEGMKAPRFLTLTKVRSMMSRELISGLRNSFTQLRHRKVWTAMGGFYNIELGTFRREGSVNVHIHSIFDRLFMPRKKLEKAWLAVTGDSHIVHIRRCEDAEDAMWYMTKHFFKIAKPEKGKVFTEKQRETLSIFLKNTRLVQGYGDMHHLKLSRNPGKCPECNVEGEWVSRTDEDTFHDVFTRTYCARYPDVSYAENRGLGGV